MLAEALGEDLDRARAELEDIETRLSALREEREALGWYERSRRNDLDSILDGHTRAHAYWSERIDDLHEQIAARPTPGEPPQLWRASDPLSASDAGLEPDLPEPAPELAPDVGIDLGP